MSKPTTLEQIMNWAMVLTGEERTGKDYYFVPEPVKRLEWSLNIAKRQLVGIIGLQGTGKTSALYYLADALREKAVKVVTIKWTGNWKDDLFLSDEVLSSSETRLLEGAIRDEFVAYRMAHKRHPFLKMVPSGTEEEAQFALENANFQAERIIGKGKVRDARDEVLKEHLGRCGAIFIDLPDYTRTNLSALTKHIAEIESLWTSIGLQNKNLIMTIQKELWDKRPHFLFGKVMPYYLNPMKPAEIMQVFQTQFPDCNLIMDDALLLLGQLARGVFRRFLKYLKLTIEAFAISNEASPISVKHVNAAVTVEQLSEDMELELGEIFKDANQRRQAMDLVNRLRQGAMNQKEIAEFLNVSEATAGKIVSRLLLYRYIERQRGEGATWVISIKV